MNMHLLKLLFYGNDDDKAQKNLQGTLVEELTHWLQGNFNDILGT